VSSDSEDQNAEVSLLIRVGRGDRSAFRDLYTRYSAPLFSFALRLTRDRAAAEELLQDTFVKIWRHAADYDSTRSQPFTSAVIILRRTCIDHLRRRRAGSPDVSLDTADVKSADFSTLETVRRSAEAEENSRQVRAALADLAPNQRDALELAFFSELTHVEIAQRLNQPVGTIKTWIRRGLFALRATLNAAE
jgi:RNA polymerase sigma-70 factor (ECF subfamily)